MINFKASGIKEKLDDIFRKFGKEWREEFDVVLYALDDTAITWQYQGKCELSLMSGSIFGVVRAKGDGEFYFKIELEDIEKLTLGNDGHSIKILVNKGGVLKINFEEE
jgi:hypothetical protein